MTQSSTKRRILIMAGGTGGHIMPALAVAKQLEEQQVEVHWLGNQHSLEDKIVRAANIQIHYISVHGLHGRSFKHWLLAPFKIARAIWDAIRIIRKLKISTVVGFGGYVSGPGGIAAWLLRKPLVIHEQNSIVGMTNRWLGKFAKLNLQAFPNAFSPAYHAITTGNPVRTEIINVTPPQQRFSERAGRLRVLVFGGSKGLPTFNRVVAPTIAELPSEKRPLVWHASGQQHLISTQELYASLNVEAKVEGFIQDMAAAYSWADLIICCGGASTITELTAVGLAAILVPYPFAVDDHQTHNCRFLVDAQAALLLAQKDFSTVTLKALLERFLDNRVELLAMAERGRQLYQANSTQIIVDYCLKAVAE